MVTHELLLDVKGFEEYSYWFIDSNATQPFVSFVNWLARAEWNLLNVTFFGGERIDESNLLRKKLYSEFI